MASFSISKISLIFILCFHLSLAKHDETDRRFVSKQTYIIRLQLPHDDNPLLLSDSQARENWYTSFLSETRKPEESEEPEVLHFYHQVFHGFAAAITPAQLEAMKKRKEFVAAWPEEILSVDTTHSPSFIGLRRDSGFWKDSNYGKGTIIGVLDTGIKPDHPSFGDEGMPPPPAKWKGKCEFSSCNNKLIGARNLVSRGGGAPEDEHGHGTHTASTAAGNFVPGANLYGNANGTAVGVAPRAHLAAYKVCAGASSCPFSAIVAGIDAAIGDGVDVLSMSLGSKSTPFHRDPIAIGTYSAMNTGIFVSMSISNTGPGRSTVSNEAPLAELGGASRCWRLPFLLCAKVLVVFNFFLPFAAPPHQKAVSASSVSIRLHTVDLTGLVERKKMRGVVEKEKRTVFFLY